MGGETLTPHKKSGEACTLRCKSPETSAQERNSRTEYETGEACTSQSGLLTVKRTAYSRADN